MARKRSIAALLVLGLPIVACGPGSPPVNTSLYSVNQPVVQRTDYVLDLATAPDGVPLSERERLDAWFRSLELGYGDRIAVDEASGYAQSEVREDIAAVAADYGLLLSEGAPMTAGAVPPGMVRVVVTRMSASVPGCPNWGGQELGGRVQTSPNFGCAINSNLAAMVADPNDLVLGQAGAAAGDPATAARAIRSYRDAQPTGARGLPETRTSTGGR
ncbi:MAG: CpaD family pilus assembly protein [Pseudomonadota bacterium]|nr:CpaD family pilus assembly protein [Pseudomonadota bacterium]